MGIVVEPTNPDARKQQAMTGEGVRLYMVRTDVHERLNILPDTPLMVSSHQRVFQLPQPGEFIVVPPMYAKDLIEKSFIVIDGKSVSYLATDAENGAALAAAIRSRKSEGKSLDQKIVAAEAAIQALGAEELLQLLKEKGVVVEPTAPAGPAPEEAPERKRPAKKESEE